MCVPNLEYQLVNPTTQVALFAVCMGNCITLRSINWKVYQATSNLTEWKLFPSMISYENIWFFGRIIVSLN